MPTTQVRGSYGLLSVDTATGVILAYDTQGEDPEYADILFFDPATLRGSHMDILETAFVDASGRYERELSWWSVEGEPDYYEFMEPAGYLPHYA